MLEVGRNWGLLWSLGCGLSSAFWRVVIRSRGFGWPLEVGVLKVGCGVSAVEPLGPGPFSRLKVLVGSLNR